MNSLAVPLMIFAVAAPLGALDVLYFHIYRFRLYSRRASALEMATHLVRGALFAVVAFILFHYRPSGAWFWFVGALMVLDFVNTLADVLVEPASRRDLGGVPLPELAIHVFGMTAGGAVIGTYFVLGWPLHAEPTALTPAQLALPAWAAWQAWVLPTSAAALTALEGGLMFHSRSKNAPMPATAA